LVNRKLKGKIIEEGYTQESLAAKIGVSRNTLSSKINGRFPFNTVEIEQICQVLHIYDRAELVDIFFQASQWDEQRL